MTAEENTRRTKARNTLLVLIILLLFCGGYYLSRSCKTDDYARSGEYNGVLGKIASLLETGVEELKGLRKAITNFKPGNTTVNHIYYACDPDAGDCKKVETNSSVSKKKSPAKKQTAKKAEPKPQPKKEVVKEQPKVEKKAEPKPEPKPEVKKEVEKQPEAPKEEVKVVEAPKPAPILAPAPVANNNPEELSCGKKSVILDSNGMPLKGLLTNMNITEEASLLMPSLSVTQVNYADEADSQMWIDCEPKGPARFKPCFNPIVDGNFVEEDGVRVGITSPRYAIDGNGKVVVDMKLGLGMNQTDAAKFKRLSELEIIQVGGRYCAVLPTS